MEQSDSDKLQPPSVDGVFARKRRERQEREASPRWAEPYAAPTPVPPEPDPAPAPTPVPAPDPIPEPIPAPSPLPMPDPIPDPAFEAEPAAEVEAEPAVEAPQFEPNIAEPVHPEPIATASTTEVTPDQRPDVSETAVLARVTEEPKVSAESAKQSAPKAPAAEKAPKTKAPRPAKAPKVPRATSEKVARTRRFPAILATIIAGACSGGVLVGLVAAFNRWGGQTDSINAVELLGAFVAAIVVGFVLLAICRIGHRAAIAFLGVGLVAVVLMFFPSDSWQTVSGSIVVVVATAVAYLGAHMIAREATSAN